MKARTFFYFKDNKWYWADGDGNTVIVESNEVATCRSKIRFLPKWAEANLYNKEVTSVGYSAPTKFLVKKIKLHFASFSIKGQKTASEDLR